VKASSPLGFDGVSIAYSRPNFPPSKKESRKGCHPLGTGLYPPTSDSKALGLAKANDA